MKLLSFLFVSTALGITLLSCDHTQASVKTLKISHNNVSILDQSGTTIERRFHPPEGYTRVAADPNSFGAYLRQLSLKAHGAKVKYYNGEVKQANVHEAVLDVDLSTKDLQQCADAVMRLRAEYLYAQKRYDEIAFRLTNGFNMEYSQWMKGNRLSVNGNQTTWKATAASGNSYQLFRDYMERVFMFAGTLSLDKQLKAQKIENLNIGDVFIKGGSPGHAVIVVDVAENSNGKKVFMIAQSYMPAQEIHILKNLNERGISPWYTVEKLPHLNSPEWRFDWHQLKTW